VLSGSQSAASNTKLQDRLFYFQTATEPIAALL